MMKFKFNLLPKETFIKREKIREKFDKTLIGSSVLPLIGISIWILIFLFNYSIKFQIAERDNLIRSNDDLISTYSEFRRDRAFLVAKMNILESIIDNDVNPDIFFGLVREILDNTGVLASINSYGRNQDGRFEVGFEVDSIEDLATIAYAFRSNPQIENFELNIVNFLPIQNQMYAFDIIFSIITEQEDDFVLDEYQQL
jgi:hypothetical protein